MLGRYRHPNHVRSKQCVPSNRQCQTGSLTLQLAGPNGPITLKFDAQTLANKQYIAPYQGGPYILGLPLGASYYTVFNVDGRTMDLVEHSASEMLALKNLTVLQKTIVV